MPSDAIRLDFRSDTVTRPTPQMRAAMAAAEVGDDVLGDDFTVQALEARVAAMFGKEAGLLLPTGTMANLAAIMSHCQRGEEYLCASGAHSYLWEAGGAAVLGSVQPQPLSVRADGTIPIEDLHAAVKDDDPHFAITRLVTIENTFAGRVLPRQHLAEVVESARERKLATHLDGARLFNAAAALGVDVGYLAVPTARKRSAMSIGRPARRSVATFASSRTSRLPRPPPKDCAVDCAAFSRRRDDPKVGRTEPDRSPNLSSQAGDAADREGRRSAALSRADSGATLPLCAHATGDLTARERGDSAHPFADTLTSLGARQA